MGAPGALPRLRAALSWPSVSTSASWTILTTCWPGVTERIDVFADRLGADLVDELENDGQRHVGVDQCRADFLERFLDIGLVDSAPRPLSRSKTPPRRDCKSVEQNRAAIPQSSNAPGGATCAAWGRSPPARRGPERPRVFPETGGRSRRAAAKSQTPAAIR